MDVTNGAVDVSVIVPARNEEAILVNCLRSLARQEHVSYEVIVVDDHSADRTREIAASFPVQVMEADPLPSGWSGKCNACWTGARAAKGKWLLFTDADTWHSFSSIATGLREAEQLDVAMLSYSPQQEVHSFAERALMPLIFADLAVTYRPKEVSDPGSPAAAANGQYLLIRRDTYDAVGGHAAVAKAILEDVELARNVKRAGYRLQFRLSAVVRTRMYRSFPQMWEGWTKNLALLFPSPEKLAAMRAGEFLLSFLGLTAFVAGLMVGNRLVALAGALVSLPVTFNFFHRIRQAHFGWINTIISPAGLPIFVLLLVNSRLHYKRKQVRWKGREYAPATTMEKVPEPRIKSAVSSR